MVTIKKEVNGITAGVRVLDNQLFTCSCGKKKIGYSDSRVATCPECGTNKIVVVDTLNKKGKARVEAVLDVIEKDDRSFHISKKELYAHVGEEDKVTLRYDKYFEMKWSLKDKTLEITKNGKLVEDEEKYASFFRGITHTEVLNTISTAGNRKLLTFAFENLGKQNGERTERLDRALIRLFDYPNLELFNFAGFDHVLDNIYKERRWLKSLETKPNKILGVPKYMMPYLRKLNKVEVYVTKTWNNLDTKFAGTNTKMIFEMIDDEADVSKVFGISDYYITLVEGFGYTNHKRLLTYLTRDLKLQQGIKDPVEGARLLVDYLRMCQKMGINPEKYSRNLKKDHDIAQMNYFMLNDERKKENFKLEMEKPVWNNILYKNKDFMIVKPIDPDELVREGETLGHCVASYVDDVIKGKCKILFMRLLATPDEGLITIEVRGSNDEDLRIVQVKGRGNREPLASEKAFINEWAEKKKLIVVY